jgi:hypothetical protein
VLNGAVTHCADFSPPESKINLSIPLAFRVGIAIDEKSRRHSSRALSQEFEFTSKLPPLEISPMRRAQEILQSDKIIEMKQRMRLGLQAIDPAARPHSPKAVDLDKRQLFSAALERPTALWCHPTGPSSDDCLPPPYGLGHIVQGSNTRKIAFAVDTLCSPFSVISEKMVSKLNLKTREENITTTLADESSPPVHSSLVATFELIIHWNGKRRTFFLEAMVWPSLPAAQDVIIGMQDALDTGLIAFALPQAWRTSWLGTACFSGNFPAALRKDQSMAMAMHHEFVMKEEDENLIDISERINLSKAHIITDATTLAASQQYWLGQFPNLNKPIPEKAHPDLPVFDPPFNAADMQQYSVKNTQKTPRSSAKLQDRINESLGALALKS